MQREIRTLMSEYIDAERKLTNALFELENGDNECKCKTGTTETIQTIAMNEHYSEIVERCLECGGFKN